MLSLKKELKIRLRGARRVAILGIGSPLRGDDALGLFFIKELKLLFNPLRSQQAASGRKPPRVRGGFTKTTKPVPLKLFSCGTTPESCTGEIKKFKPSHIIIVDAFDMGKEVGSISIIDAKKKSANGSASLAMSLKCSQSANVSFSTHAMPLKILVDYLSHYLNPEIIFIGIQAKNTEFLPVGRQVGAKLSYEVNKSVKQIAHSIKESLMGISWKPKDEFMAVAGRRS
jgi:hydrogenase 3 maturation protease